MSNYNSRQHNAMRKLQYIYFSGGYCEIFRPAGATRYTGEQGWGEAGGPKTENYTKFTPKFGIQNGSQYSMSDRA